jgi:hypothetical protein
MATAALRVAARRRKLVERDVMAKIVGDLDADAGWPSPLLVAGERDGHRRETRR